ncbi:MAG: two-component system sensor histidine kinase NtrB, partial [Peptococcales bacterium]
MCNMAFRTIDNYIFPVQVFFSLILMVVFFKNFGIEIYNLSQAFLATFFFTCLLGSIICFIIYSGKNNKIVDYCIVLLDIVLITIITTVYGEIKLLFLVPIIIAAIKFSFFQSIIITMGIGIINLLTDFYFAESLPRLYTLETTLVFFLMCIIVNWLISSFVKVEKDIRYSLYATNEVLERKSSLLKKIINEMPLSIAVIDKNERIVHINQVALDFAGIKNKNPEQFIGLEYKKYLDQLFDNNYNYEDLFILDTLHNGESYFKESAIRNNMLIEGIYQPICDNEGNIIYAVGIFYDITSDEILNERIRNLERMRIIGQMGASIAHEIKNPLTTIKGFLQFAEKSQEGLSKTQLALLISEIDRCYSIVNDTLSLSKKTNSKAEMHNLKSLLERQLILIEREAILKKVSLHVDIDEALLEVKENEIKQLFLNLTHNALEAMPQGGNLYIQLKEATDKIVLEVEDTGYGIPEEIIKKL